MPRGRPRKNPLTDPTAPSPLRKANGRNNTGDGSGFEQAFRAIDNVLRKEAGCTTELDYTEQTSWLFF